MDLAEELGQLQTNAWSVFLYSDGEDVFFLGFLQKRELPQELATGADCAPCFWQPVAEVV